MSYDWPPNLLNSMHIFINVTVFTTVIQYNTLKICSKLGNCFPFHIFWCFRCLSVCVCVLLFLIMFFIQKLIFILRLSRLEAKQYIFQFTPYKAELYKSSTLVLNMSAVWRRAIPHRLLWEQKLIVTEHWYFIHKLFKYTVSFIQSLKYVS